MINLYPVDNAIGFVIAYQLDSDLFSRGHLYPLSEQLGPEGHFMDPQFDYLSKVYLLYFT